MWKLDDRGRRRCLSAAKQAGKITETEAVNHETKEETSWNGVRGITEEER